MLDESQRSDRYLAQTGRKGLTPRQIRRIAKKWNAQSQESAARREGRAIVRQSAVLRRKARLAGLAPTA